MHPVRQPPSKHLDSVMQAQFGADVASEGDTYVVRIRGELDRYDCPRLEQILVAADSSHATRIVLDIEELSFIDGAGVEVLLAAVRQSESNGGRLRLTPDNANVARIFGFLRFDRSLPLAPHGLDLKEDVHSGLGR